MTGYVTRLRTGLCALAVLTLTAAPALAGGMAKAKMDIVDTAVSAGSFNTLVTAVQAAGLVETLKGTGPFTVFAPTDEAFSRIPKAQLDALLADKKALTEVLTYHVVAGKLMAADVVGLESAATVQGESITIDTMDGVKVDGAKVVKTDIETSNGVIHVIDAVILPKSVSETSAAPVDRVERSLAQWKYWDEMSSYGR